MGQVLHGCARTAEVVRREIQNRKESMKALSERLGINYKTVVKWKNRDFVHDMPMGAKNSHSTVLTRSSLYRLFQRNGISKLPENEEKKPKKVQTVSDLTDNGVQFTNQARNHRALPHNF